MLNLHSSLQCAPVKALAVLLLAIGTMNAQHYTRTDLTQNMTGVSPTAPNTDPNMVNPWGISRSSGGPWWISDNGTGLSTLYDGTGAAQSLTVFIPGPSGTTTADAPSGAVFNYTGQFPVEPGKGSSFFIFCTEGGTISGWNPSVLPSRAIRTVDRSHTAEYKGCAIAQASAGPQFYATNFTTGKVEVFDGTFKRLTTPSSAFTDSSLPADYVPFNIQNVGGNLVVTFAHRLPGSHDEDHGPGLGYVDVFDVNGKLVLRLDHGTFLNAPWGVTESPADFGAYSHRLLIGNFGDGTIDAYNMITGHYEGKLLDSTGAAIWIDGLWGLSFGNGTGAGNNTDLYFTAGPNGESQGLFGKISPVSTEERGNTE